jgi:exodeoxyribonuclease V alpha subunit
MSQALLNLLQSRWGLNGAALEAAEALVLSWEKGHTGLVVDKGHLAALKASPAVAAKANLRDPKPLVLQGNLLQSWRHCQAEQALATQLTALAAAGVEAIDAKLELDFSGLFKETNDPQAKAVRIGLTRKLALITGGPGTGKTHTAARILALKLFQNPHLRYALTAPTGKAAQRLAESVGKAADKLEGPVAAVAQQLRESGAHSSTLHRLLEWRPDQDRCARNEARPLALDLVIVDEASMLDLMLWRALLRALPTGATLVVLGDPYQLESIEPGRVLGSLLQAAEAAGALEGCHVELTKNYRFAERTGIATLAQAVRNQTGKPGEADAVVAACPLANGKDMEVSRYDSDGLDRALDKVWGQVLAVALAKDAKEALTALAGLRVLCALNEGKWGVSGLNERIEKRLEREGHGHCAYPVLVSVNDPHSGLFNGDLGVLLPGPGGGTAVFMGPAGILNLPAMHLPEHKKAWAMTVHRSQGSEYGSVVLVLPPLDKESAAYELLRRELLYTAVTRAQNMVLVVADEAVLRAACAPGEVRVSGLKGWMG